MKPKTKRIQGAHLQEGTRDAVGVGHHEAQPPGVWVVGTLARLQLDVGQDGKVAGAAAQHSVKQLALLFVAGAPLDPAAVPVYCCYDFDGHDVVTKQAKASAGVAVAT